MIGARFEGDGTRFRVWAPNADGAFVAWDGHWTRDAAFPLTAVGDGWFEGKSAGVPVGARYRFIFVEGENEVSRIDPAARDTNHSGVGDPANGGFVVDPAFEWPDFRTPPFDELIIYQFHVGAFSGRNDQFSATVHDDTGTLAMAREKLGYVREMGFNAVELLPIQEFQGNRSWGYNPSFFFSIESAYGSPADLRAFVARAHELGLAVIFDVVYNHVTDSKGDNPLWGWDVFDENTRGAYLERRFDTDWGPGPNFEKAPVREFFIQNALMLLEEYRGDGLRFDYTKKIDENQGWPFLQELTWRVKERHPGAYLVAENFPEHTSIVTGAGMHATWCADSHHEFQRAARGDNPVGRVKWLIGKVLGPGREYPNAWNLVKYCLGSHDDCGDDKDGNTIDEGEDWKRHRHFVEFYGGRGNWHARAKARLGWAVNVAALGTPMLFMGSECHHPGYWHDYTDNGDHRFDWSVAGDPIGVEMRRLVAAANAVRRENPALRGETLSVVHEDPANQVLAWKRYVPGGGNCVLVIANLGDRTFTDHSYGVPTGGQPGRWVQILCTQDAAFGGWDGAGNAFHEPWTQDDGKVYVNVPQWSVTMLRLA